MKRLWPSIPTNQQVHVNLISLYARTGNPDKAKQHFSAATTAESTPAGRLVQLWCAAVSGAKLRRRRQGFIRRDH